MRLKYEKTPVQYWTVINFMLRKMSAITIILVLLIVSGCNKDISIKPDLGKNKTEIILKPGEFRFVKTVHGEASTYFLF